MTTQYVYTFRGHVYSTRQQALEDFASAVFDFCVTDNTEDMSHEEKIFYALCVIENSPYRTGEYMIKFLIADAISFIKLVQFETKFPYLTQDLKFVGLKLC